MTAHLPPPSECDACGSDRVVLTTQRSVYGSNAINPERRIYFCKACRASVGLHDNTDSPMGYLAGPRIRALRAVAHSVLEPLWLTKVFKRDEAYDFLCAELNVPIDRQHIALFTVDELERAITFLNAFDLGEYARQRARKAEKTRQREARANARIERFNEQSNAFRKRRRR